MYFLFYLINLKRNLQLNVFLLLDKNVFKIINIILKIVLLNS